jgi:hypothetical protein
MPSVGAIPMIFRKVKIIRIMVIFNLKNRPVISLFLDCFKKITILLRLKNSSNCDNIKLVVIAKILLLPASLKIKIVNKAEVSWLNNK